MTTHSAWTHEDTKLWIHEQYLKLEDIHYYLNATVQWLEAQGHTDRKLVFICSFMTIIWVNHLRGYPTSKQEIFELLEMPVLDQIKDQLYVLPAVYVQMDIEHEELLALVVKNKIDI